MKKGVTPILIIFLGILIIGGGFLSIKFFSTGRKNQNNNTPPSTGPVANGSSKQPTQQQNQPTVNVPLPSEKDIIRNFFQLINERKIPEAITMMSDEMIGDDPTKQTWGVHFNAIKSINIQKIEPSMQENWETNRHTYKVTLEAYVSSDAANAPIPYYGWGDNPNIRWVSITKEDNLWKIAEIATGP